MTLWPSRPPPPPPPSLPSERNCSPGPKQCIFTLDTVAPCHVNKVRVFAWRFNTAADKSAQECLPVGDKGTLRGHCAIPGGVPLWSPLSTPNSSSSRPRHMSLITTSSQNKAYLLKTAGCPRPQVRIIVILRGFAHERTCCCRSDQRDGCLTSPKPR